MTRLNYGRKDITVILLSVLFVLTELVLFFAVQMSSFSDFARYAYSSVVLAFLFSFLSLVYDPRDGWLVRLGLLFTLGADYCLVVMSPAEELLGVVIFTFTQACYFLYIFKESKNRRVDRAHLITRAALSVLALTVPYLVLGKDTDLLSVVSVFYYAQLLSNLIFSFFNKKLRMFSIGLVLFALCDLAIGIDRLSNGYFPQEKGNILYLITHTGLNNSWLFYLPSQTLIPFSLIIKKREVR